MSEERLERIENQLGQVLQVMVGLGNRMTGLEGQMTGLENRMTGLEGQMTGLENRMTGLEGQMTGLENRMTGLEGQMTGLDNRMTGLEGQMTGLDNRMTGLENRTEVVEGTLLATMRGGFNFIRGHINDLDVDLARNERKSEDSARQIRRLNRRLMHLEGRTDEDPDNF